jgi:hypothetical protein
MPGPFPGMDPYLESAPLWAGVHQGIIGSLRALLNTLLPPGYVADMGERVYVAQLDRSIYPDVVIFEQGTPLPLALGSAQSAMLVADPPTVVQVEAVEVREVFIEIVPIGDETRVVTVIEVLSYANKAAGSDGRELYLTKQQELLQSRVNLIEIDLLRRGEHTLAVPRTHNALPGRWDYLMCLHRSGQRGRFETWPRTVRERLPRIHVPLENGLPDVTLDLQTVFDRNYDEGAYARRIDYRREPPTPLRSEDAAWAADLLRQNGVRPG